MTNLSVINILKKVYGAKGVMFPDKPSANNIINTVTGFDVTNEWTYSNKTKNGLDIRKYQDEKTGKYEFMPVTIDGIDIPNALISISGEKEFIETNVVGAIVGTDEKNKPIISGATVFEKAFTKPYDITLIATLIGEGSFKYPEAQMWLLTNLWKKDDVVTVSCALADFFIPQKNNALIKKITVLDNQGAECVEVIQFDLRSNIEFELLIND